MSRRLLDRPEIVSHDIVTRAMHEAKSDDFGGMSWSEPLEVLTRSLDREASLTMSGRRAARDRLVARLLDRRPIRDVTSDGTGAVPTVVVTGPDPDSVRSGEQALGGSGIDGITLLESTFTSMSFEVDAHIPSYAEWLTEADLHAPYADVARRCTHRVLGAMDFAERTAEIDRALPGALLVEIDRPLEDAVEAITHHSVLGRRPDSRTVDPAKVERYWRWRLGLRQERRAGARPADLTVGYDELVAAPAAFAAAVASAVGGSSPPR